MRLSWVRLSCLAAVALVVALVGCAPRRDSEAQWPEVPMVPAGPRPGMRLPDWAVPSGYILDLRIDPEAERYSGRVSIELAVRKPTTLLVLDSGVARVTAAGLMQGGTAIPIRLEAQPGEGLRVRTGRPLEVGSARLVLEFVGRVTQGERGLLAGGAKGQRYVYSHFEPLAARAGFPCFDEPRFKAPFQVNLVVPKGDLALSNMPQQSETPSEDGKWVTHHFSRSPSLPTYAVAVAVGPFEVKAGGEGPVPIRLVAPPGGGVRWTRVLGTAERQVKAAVSLLGAFPFPKLDLLAVSGMPFGIAMEHPGLVTVQDHYVFVDDRSAGWVKDEQDRLVSHEIAHMWFGNQVTPDWWDETWLNEGLATWLEGEICALADSECNSAAARSEQKALAMRLDGWPGARPVRQEVHNDVAARATFNDFTYFKGMSLIQMVAHWIGREQLVGGLRQYLAEHQWGNVTTGDLTRALGAAGGVDVAGVLDGFLNRTGVPVIDMRLECGEVPTLRVSQRRHWREEGKPPEVAPWTIPVCVRFDAGSGMQEQCWVMGRERAELALDARECPTFVAPNAQDAGYYYYAVDEAWLRELVKGKARLSESERIGLIADLSGLAMSGQLGVDVALDLMGGFSDETSLRVWVRILSALNSYQWWVPRGAEADYARYVRELAGERARALIGATGRDARALRGRLLLALGQQGRDPWAIEQSQAATQRWLAQPLGVDADLAGAAIAVQASAGNERLIEALVKTLRTSPRVDQRSAARYALASYQEPKLVRRVLELTLSEQLAPADRQALLSLIVQQYAARHVVWQWIESSLARIEQHVPPVAQLEVLHVLRSLCDEAAADRGARFLESHLGKTSPLTGRVQAVADEAKHCAALAGRHGPGMARYLQARGAQDSSESGRR